MTVEVLRPETSPSEVAYECIPSPLGVLTVIASERGLLAVEVGRMSARQVRDLIEPRRIPTTCLGSGAKRAAKRATDGAEQLREYFAGDRREFTLAIDLFGVTAFRARVLTELLKVPFAALTTYGKLAARIGKPRAGQAVGGAVGANPWVIVVPCHRVIAGDGSLGGFSSGLSRKRRLLSQEGLTPPEGGWPGRAGSVGISMGPCQRSD